MKNEYKVGVRNLIPLYGLKKFINENPAPSGQDISENRVYALRALPISLYNLAFTFGMAGMVAKGLETLLK